MEILFMSLLTTLSQLTNDKIKQQLKIPINFIILDLSLLMENKDKKEHILNPPKLILMIQACHQH